MRKFILVAALVLASASAQAADSRSLTRASGDDQAVAAAGQAGPAEAPKAVEETKPMDAPKYLDRPAAVNTAADAPKADPAKPAQVRKAERRKPRRDWTEARIIGELRRHGIYW